jgi:hypothetical protein
MWCATKAQRACALRSCSFPTAEGEEKKEVQKRKTRKYRMASKKAKKLVVDTNAFIKGVRLETIGQEFYTIPQVCTSFHSY